MPALDQRSIFGALKLNLLGSMICSGPVHPAGPLAVMVTPLILFGGNLSPRLKFSKSSSAVPCLQNGLFETEERAISTVSSKVVLCLACNMQEASGSASATTKQAESNFHMAHQRTTWVR